MGRWVAVGWLSVVIVGCVAPPPRLTPLREDCLPATGREPADQKVVVGPFELPPWWDAFAERMKDARELTLLTSGRLLVKDRSRSDGSTETASLCLPREVTRSIFALLRSKPKDKDPNGQLSRLCVVGDKGGCRAEVVEALLDAVGTALDVAGRRDCLTGLCRIRMSSEHPETTTWRVSLELNGRWRCEKPTDGDSYRVAKGRLGPESVTALAAWLLRKVERRFICRCDKSPYRSVRLDQQEGGGELPAHSAMVVTERWRTIAAQLDPLCVPDKMPMANGLESESCCSSCSCNCSPWPPARP